MIFIPTSSDVVALCNAQVALLTQGLGATVCAIYITQEWLEETKAKLLPVVVYPDVAAESMILTLPPSQDQSPRLLKAAVSFDESEATAEVEDPLLQQRQILLPLLYEGVVMGFLVTSRDDRPWNPQEALQIEKIARTIAIAIAIDRRRAWYEQHYQSQRSLADYQRDRLDDLLHQFRNPLTALRTFGKLLIKRLQPADENQKVATGIVRESDRLQELLQQFDSCIDLTEADLFGEIPSEKPLPLLPAHSNNLSLETFAVGFVLEPLLVSARAIAQDRNLALTTHIPANLPPITADAKALREVFSNLIDNALKYTPSGGEIAVDVREERGGVQIAIADTGPGIPSQDLEHLFERHYRGVQAETSIPGSGLGLAIAKELIQQMQGEIQVVSPSKNNRGTTFKVWLSIAKY